MHRTLKPLISNQISGYAAEYLSLIKYNKYYYQGHVYVMIKLIGRFADKLYDSCFYLG